MIIYFVYRGNNAGPAGKHIHHVEADSILDVFRANWRLVDGDPDKDNEVEAELYRRGEAAFGPGYVCLSGLSFAIAANGWRPPRSLRELHDRLEWLESNKWINGLTLGPHHLAVLDTNDIVEFALYVFDEHYAARHPDKVAFLQRRQWELPTRAADGPFVPAVECSQVPQGCKGEGCTFVVFLGIEDHYGLRHLGSENCLRIDGVRLPELPRYLLTAVNPEDDYTPWEMRSLHAGLSHFTAGLTGYDRAFFDAVRSDPLGDFAWGAYSDWLQEQGRPSASVAVTAELLRRCPPSRWHDAGNRPEDMVVAHTHVAQACKRLNGHRGEPAFYHIILFDDRWAAAHPDLANSVLRFAARWDVL